MAEKKQNKPKIGIGYRVGKLTVEEATPQRRSGYTVWCCRCDCGNECLAPITQLTSGYKKSCGCLQKTQIIENLKLVDGTSVTKLDAGQIN